MIDKEIVDILKKEGIEKGDVVLVASNISKLLFNLSKRRKCQLNKEIAKSLIDMIIDSLQHCISEEGTILFPTYNWDFCTGKPFDYKKTKSETGVLSQIALEREDFIRTQHPIYSFAVWGRDQDFLYKMEDKNSFLGNTPFNYLFEKNAKMIIIDELLNNSFTYVHYVEERCKVQYRFKKKFTAEYIDINNNKSLREYFMYVRYLDEEKNVITDFSGLEKLLMKNKVMKIFDLIGVDVRVLSFKSADKIIENDIIYNGSRNLISC